MLCYITQEQLIQYAQELKLNDSNERYKEQEQFRTKINNLEQQLRHFKKIEKQNKQVQINKELRQSQLQELQNQQDTDIWNNKSNNIERVKELNRFYTHQQIESITSDIKDRNKMILDLSARLQDDQCNIVSFVLRGQHKLENLNINLRDCLLKDSGIAVLTKGISSVDSLKFLNINFKNINLDQSNIGYQIFELLKNSKNLLSFQLNLESTKISFEQTVKIANAIQHNLSIKSLYMNLYNNQITQLQLNELNLKCSNIKDKQIVANTLR